MVGTMLRHDSLLKKVIEGRIKESINLAGQGKCYWTGWRKQEYKMLKRMAEDRTEWCW